MLGLGIQQKSTRVLAWESRRRRSRNRGQVKARARCCSQKTKNHQKVPRRLAVVNRERRSRSSVLASRGGCRQVQDKGQQVLERKNKARGLRLLALKCGGKSWSPSLANFKHSESCPAPRSLVQAAADVNVFDTCKSKANGCKIVQTTNKTETGQDIML